MGRTGLNRLNRDLKPVKNGLRFTVKTSNNGRLSIIPLKYDQFEVCSIKNQPFQEMFEQFFPL